MVNRLLNVSSLLLVVLSLIFTQFMAASKFWHGRAIDLELKLLELTKNPSKESKEVMRKKIVEEVQKKREAFETDHQMQAKYARMFAALMGILFLLVAFCFPIGEWTNAPAVVRSVSVILMVALVAMASVGFSYACRIWDP